jgi:hypothetical protein
MNQVRVIKGRRGFGTDTIGMHIQASLGSANLLMAVTSASGMMNKSTGGLMDLRMELKSNWVLSKDKSAYSLFQANRT